MHKLVEKVQEKILVNGLYQKCLIVMTIFIGLSTFYLSPLITLMKTKPLSLCYDNHDLTKKLRVCEEVDLCNMDVVKIPKPGEKIYLNWEAEFNVGCEKKYAFDYINSGRFGGSLISSFFFSKLPDIYGRRKIIIIQVILSIIVMFIAFFGNSIEFFIWWITIYSILNQILVPHLVFLKESINQELYSYITGSIMLLSPLGFLIVSYILSIYQNWRIVHLFYLIISFITLGFAVLVAETPSFYISIHNFKEFGISCQYIAHVNGDLKKIASELDMIIGTLITKQKRLDRKAGIAIA